MIYFHFATGQKAGLDERIILEVGPVIAEGLNAVFHKLFRDVIGGNFFAVGGSFASH